MSTSLTTQDVGRPRLDRDHGAIAGGRLHRDEQLAEVVGARVDGRVGSALELGRARLLRVALVQQRDVVEDDVAGDRLQPFGAHLPEPAAQLVAGEADRAADDDEVAGEAPADDRAGRVRARAPAVARAEQVERRQRGDDLGRRGQEERLIGMEGDQRRRADAVDRAHVEGEALRRQARAAQDRGDGGRQRAGGRALRLDIRARRRSRLGGTLRARRERRRGHEHERQADRGGDDASQRGPSGRGVGAAS